MPDEPIFLEIASAPAPDPSTLKDRSATALERALAFVDAHGSALDRLRARVTLQAEPREALIDALESAQASDGSFPRLGIPLVEALGFEDLDAHAGAAVAGVIDGLAALADARALHCPGAERAEACLRGWQNPDGSWGPEAGDPEGRLFATGKLAGLLGRTRFVRPEVLEGAGRFLGGLWSPERVEGGRWSAIAAFAHFFTNVHHDLSDEALQWCGRELERGFRSRRFDALPTARVLLDCDASALPGFAVEPLEILVRLLDEQAGDGGFAELASGGPGARVGASLDALRAVIALNASF